MYEIEIIINGSCNDCLREIVFTNTFEVQFDEDRAEILEKRLSISCPFCFNGIVDIPYGNYKFV